VLVARDCAVYQWVRAWPRTGKTRKLPGFLTMHRPAEFPAPQESARRGRSGRRCTSCGWPVDTIS